MTRRRIAGPFIFAALLTLLAFRLDLRSFATAHDAGGYAGDRPAAPLSQADAGEDLRSAAAAVQAAFHAVLNPPSDDPNPDWALYREKHGQALKSALIRYVVAFYRAHPGASRDELTGALEQVYKASLEPYVTNTPYTVTANLHQQRFLIVGWLLLRDQAATKWLIQAFKYIASIPAPIASTGEEVEGHGLLLQQINSPVPDEVWLLAHGQRFDDTGIRSNLVLYSFDGTRFRTRWSRMAVPYLKVQVNGNVIRVTYGKGRPGTMGREIDKYIEEYRTTKTGLRLVRGPVKLPPQ